MKMKQSLTVIGLLLAGLAFNSTAMAFGQLKVAKGMSNQGAGTDDQTSSTTVSADLLLAEAAMSEIFI